MEYQSLLQEVRLSPPSHTPSDCFKLAHARAAL